MTFHCLTRLLTPLFFGLVPLGAQTPAPAPAVAAPPAANATASGTGAQTPPAPAPAATVAPAAATRSIWDGVYSDAQISRGKKAFNSLCARCHGEGLLGNDDSPALVEADFLKDIEGKTVGSLVERTRKTMPSDGPGKVSRQQCTDITAYVLSSNGFPAGKSDLPTDLEAQNQILIRQKK